ncbi:MAG: CatB-related O-acetyltransferase [Coriobacteriia bacterium]|nr:CatB-related O-acetyltransferase [Coriobacteriia bacterium]
MQHILYYLAKFFQKIQLPSLRNCVIDRTAHVLQKSNLIDVSIGRYSYVGVANSICNTSIGSFCSIASYCAIGGGNHPLDYVSTSPVFLDGHNVFGTNIATLSFDAAPQTHIGNDVWIGEACFIKAGVRIGDGAVVGAHSVVTRDIPPYAVVAGSPARILKFRFTNEVIQRLEGIAWWDWDDTQLRSRAKLFDSPESLLGSLDD